MKSADRRELQELKLSELPAIERERIAAEMLNSMTHTFAYHLRTGGKKKVLDKDRSKIAYAIDLWQEAQQRWMQEGK